VSVLGLQGVCIDTGSSTNLQNGNKYYLFPHGSQAFHASRFQREGSHFGTYQKERFKIIEEMEEWPSEPIKPSNLPILQIGTVYKAELVWRKQGYADSIPLRTYFIAAIDNCYACATDCYFYLDAALKESKGRFPLHWFESIQEYDEKAIMELPRSDWQQMDLFTI